MKVLECESIKKEEMAKLRENIASRLILVIIKIGKFIENDVYLKSLRKNSLDLGIELREIEYFKDDNSIDIISKIIELNEDENVVGIMIQKPIIDKFDYNELVNYIDYRKDIDGMTRINQLRLKNDKECLIPCTVSAIIKILDKYRIKINNKKICIIGKSNLVGKPLYEILKRTNQVILCNSKTDNLKAVIKNADIIITAIGKPNFFTDDYFINGQIIIDVGINVFEGKIVGDVDFSSLDKDVFITPVPGGVGQLTPVCLFWNLVKAKKMLTKTD